MFGLKSRNYPLYKNQYRKNFIAQNIKALTRKKSNVAHYNARNEAYKIKVKKEIVHLRAVRGKKKKSKYLKK